MRNQDFAKILEKLNSPEELSQYAEDLFKTVQVLTENLEKQAGEIVKLKQRLEKSDDSDVTSSKLDDAETIARTQLYILQTQSQLGELNAEQSKKVDLYARLLISMTEKENKQDSKSKVQKLETVDLLKILNEKPQ